METTYYSYCHTVNWEQFHQKVSRVVERSNCQLILTMTRVKCARPRITVMGFTSPLTLTYLDLGASSLVTPASHCFLLNLSADPGPSAKCHRQISWSFRCHLFFSGWSRLLSNSWPGEVSKKMPSSATQVDDVQYDVKEDMEWCGGWCEGRCGEWCGGWDEVSCR